MANLCLLGFYLLDSTNFLNLVFIFFGCLSSLLIYLFIFFFKPIHTNTEIDTLTVFKYVSPKIPQTQQSPKNNQIWNPLLLKKKKKKAETTQTKPDRLVKTLKKL